MKRSTEYRLIGWAFIIAPPVLYVTTGIAVESYERCIIAAMMCICTAAILDEIHADRNGGE